MEVNNKKQITVVRNRTDIVYTPEIDKLEKIFTVKNNLENFFVMCCVSRMVKLKNFDLIIDAINLLKDKNLKIKVLLVGDGDDKKYFENKVKKLGLQNYFIFTGMLTDRQQLGSIYKASALVLFPSITETAGLIQNEAAAFEKPTLAIKGIAPSEVIVDGVSGFVCDNDPQQFADKIIYAYNNQEKLKAMGKRAKETIYQCYDKNYANQILQLYQTYIDEYKTKHCKKAKQKYKVTKK